MAQSGNVSEQSQTRADRSKRNRPWTEAEGREIATEWKASGETVTEFARRRGWSPGRVWKLLRRLNGATSASGPTMFRPVRVVEEANATVGTIDIVVGGAVVRVGPTFDSALLVRVLQALTEVEVAC